MENKQVTHTGRTILRLWNTGWFAAVWIRYYNRYMFDTYHFLGAVFCILMFFIIYSVLCNVYKAFRIASTDVGEIVFSQFVSFAAADLILYIEALLVYNQYVHIQPGLLTVLIQLVGTAVIVLTTKRYFMCHVIPQPTIIIHGAHISPVTVDMFSKRLLHKYRHLFHVQEILNVNLPIDLLTQKIKETDTVILYKISGEERYFFSRMCIEQKKNFYYTPNVEDILEQGCEPKHLLDTPMMKYAYTYENARKQIVKRIMDILFSILFIVLTSPIMLIAAICIKLEDGGPVFFRQDRCTKGGRVFKILKFRSMVVNAEQMGCTPSVEGDPRITRVGNVIRAMRIDELPQFFNILKGDMSFVGPRPERVEHVEMYTCQVPEFTYRMAVKGGLTGYAQVYGKYNTSAYDKLLLDLMYIEQQSVLLDLKIMLLTIRTVFRKESTEGFDEEISKEMNELVREIHGQNRSGKTVTAESEVKTGTEPKNGPEKE